MQVAEAPPPVETHQRTRRTSRSWWRPIEYVAAFVLPVITVLVVVWPMVAQPHQAFGGDDWLNHLWYVWHQGAWMHGHVLPTYYINYADGVFYPPYAFYAGTLNALAGGTSAVLGGDGLPAYIAWWTLAVTIAYGGFYWLGRMAGLGRWAAQVPAVVFVTSAYYITVIYARGDWTEFVAVSTMPMLVASSIHVATGRRLSIPAAAALAASVVLFTGSHTVTLIYGGFFLLVLTVATAVAVPDARRLVSRSGAGRWVKIAVPAVLVNAWFLVPLLAYQHLTRIGAANALSEQMLTLAKPIVRPEALFTLERASAIAPFRQFDVGLPVLAMAWVLVTLGAVLVRRVGGAWRRLLLVLVLVTAALSLLMMDVGLFLALPAKAQLLQFTYRLESFVLMGVAGAVLVALVLLRGRSRAAQAWMLLLVPLVAYSLIGAHRQVDRHPVGLEPKSTFGQLRAVWVGDYADGTLPELSGNLPAVDFRWDRIRNNRAAATTDAGAGQYVASNLLTIPALVHIDGAKMVGVRLVGTALSPLRPAILQIDADAPPGPVTIRVRPANPWPVVLGKLLSTLGVLGLIANFVAIGVGARRRRRVREAEAPGG